MEAGLPSGIITFAMRKIRFAKGEFYHVYNRGVDKRPIFLDVEDIKRFYQSMEEFNTKNPIGSIFENSFAKKNKLGSGASKLVNFISYCLNPNHYHFILEQVLDNGIEKFLHRLGTGYTKYFNNKQKRSGYLFQGAFKSSHINSNEYLLHVSAYVNLNKRVHKISDKNLSWSSWNEYVGKTKNSFCKKDIITGQFKSSEEYKNFAENSLVDILKRKEAEKEIENLLLD